MYLDRVNLDTAFAIIEGYDLGVQGGLLCGFREWLVTRVGFGNNRAWYVLVRELLRRERVRGDPAKFDFVFKLIEEFSDLCSTPYGRRRVFSEYEDWLAKQDWYTPASPQWLKRSSR